MSHGVPKSIQVKHQKQFIDMDLHDFCNNLLSSAVDQSKPVPQLRDAILSQLPSQLCGHSKVVEALRTVPATYEVTSISEESEDFLQTVRAQEDRLGKVACYRAFTHCS